MEVSTIIHCLGLGHEAMVSVVYVFLYSSSFECGCVYEWGWGVGGGGGGGEGWGWGGGGGGVGVGVGGGGVGGWLWYRTITTSFAAYNIYDSGFFLATQDRQGKARQDISVASAKREQMGAH